MGLERGLESNHGIIEEYHPVYTEFEMQLLSKFHIYTKKIIQVQDADQNNNFFEFQIRITTARMVLFKNDIHFWIQ